MHDYFSNILEKLMQEEFGEVPYQTTITGNYNHKEVEDKHGETKEMVIDVVIDKPAPYIGESMMVRKLHFEASKMILDLILGTMPESVSRLGDSKNVALTRKLWDGIRDINRDFNISRDVRALDNWGIQMSIDVKGTDEGMKLNIVYKYNRGGVLSKDCYYKLIEV